MSKQSGKRFTGWLYRYEARGIQGYVTATARLEEVAGASALVEALKDHAVELAAWAKGSILADPAGSATIAFGDEEGAHRFAEWWPMVVERIAPGLTVVQAAVDSSAHEYPLAALRERLDAACQYRHAELPEAGPWTQRSGRSGRPAVTRGRRKGKRDMRDAATERKVAALNHMQDSGQVGLDDDALGRRFLGELDTRGRPLVSRHEDFGDGYVAVIHIDGNDMGERVLSLATVEEYRDFAAALTAATESAAQAAMAGLAHADEQRRERLRVSGARVRADEPIPARPVVLGGDDCIIVTLAEDALSFVTRYLETLERQGRASVFDGRSLSATAGIAFIKPRAPISEGLRLATDLCHDAKTRLRGSAANGGTPSSVMFHRVTTAGFAAWQDIQLQELAAVPPGHTKKLSGSLVYGPYQLNGERSVPQLATLTLASRSLPSGPLREWLSVSRLDPGRAAVRWQRLREVTVARSAERWRLFADALVALGADPDNGWGLSLSREPHRATPIHDAITWGMLAPRPVTSLAGTAAVA